MIHPVAKPVVGPGRRIQPGDVLAAAGRPFGTALTAVLEIGCPGPEQPGNGMKKNSFDIRTHHLERLLGGLKPHELGSWENGIISHFQMTDLYQ